MRGVRSSRSCVSDPPPSWPHRSGGGEGKEGGRFLGGHTDGTGWDGLQVPALWGLEVLRGAGEGIDWLGGAEAQGTSPARHLFPQRLSRLGWRLRVRQGTAPKLF